jgi:hypothetical protein
MPTLPRRFQAWLPGNPDEAVLRWIFRGVVTVTIVVLAADLARLNGWIVYPDLAAAPTEIQQNLPSLNLPGLPSILAPLLPESDKRLTPLPKPEGILANPMTIELLGGGKLMVTGTITPGISKAFATEIDKHGDYIKTVVLNSPGGSIADAMAMGRLIREKKLSTEVEAGKYCASSCPLLLAGGIERRAGDGAMIGVHQVAAVTSAANSPPRDEMSVTQDISARCLRYLAEMGVNLQVWVHAMETPHDKLFVFKPDELKALNLATTITAAAPAPPAPAKARSSESAIAAPR